MLARNAVILLNVITVPLICPVLYGGYPNNERSFCRTNVMLCCHASADRLRAPPFEVLRVTEQRNSARRTANVRGPKPESIGGRQIEARDNKIAPQNDNWNANRVKNFSDVVCRGVHFIIAGCGRRPLLPGPSSTGGEVILHWPMLCRDRGCAAARGQQVWARLGATPAATPLRAAS